MRITQTVVSSASIFFFLLADELPMLDFLFFVLVLVLIFGLLISDRFFAATEEGDFGDRAGDFGVFAFIGLEFVMFAFFAVEVVLGVLKVTLSFSDS